MAVHDFRVLSDREFEALVGDLLQAEFDTHVEQFTQGPDGGVDLRWSFDRGTAIGQCKHYPRSGFPKLLQSLDKEVSKVEKLRPDAYYVITSIGLTPSNKDKILKKFRPWMTGPENIHGADDIEGLLTRHPRVERQHVKLLFSSGAQLSAVVHAGIVNRTAALQDRIRKALPKYCVTEAHHEAQRLLDQHRVCIISGAPGAGKTTLAQMLLAQAIAHGFSPVDVSGDIDEASTMYRPDENQIFFYDDFLGEFSYGEQLGMKNEQTRLLNFISQVRRSAKALLVMTTREYILRSARRTSDPVARITSEPYVLRIGKASPEDAALILYNHLWHADLPAVAKDDLTAVGWKKIAEHDSFSPRIVEWCTRADFVADGSSYAHRLLDALDNPEVLWERTFNALPELERLLLYVLATLYGRHNTEDHIRDLLEELCREAGERFTGSGFGRALDVVEGTFTTVDSLTVTHSDSLEGGMPRPVRELRFVNPSIRSYVLSRLTSDLTTCRAVLRTATWLNALELLWFGDEHGLEEGFRLPRPRLNPGLREAYVTAAERITDATRDYWRMLLFWNCMPADWRPSLTWLVTQMESHLDQLQGDGPSEGIRPSTYDDVLDGLRGTDLARRLHASIDRLVDLDGFEDDMDEWRQLASHMAHHRESCTLVGSKALKDAFEAVALPILHQAQPMDLERLLEIADAARYLEISSTDTPLGAAITRAFTLISRPSQDPDRRERLEPSGADLSRAFKKLLEHE
jgi:hypothetical protein